MNDAWITDAPRLELGFLPTPLVPLERLSARLGGPRLWLKRDDCTGLATGGNKTRKLEYLLADALRQQADVIVTFGAVQSNHARQTAAACAVAGLPCHLVLARKVPWPHPQYDRAGNVLLDRLLGASVRMVEPGEFAAVRDDLLDGLERSGKLPYAIPVGGSSHVGAMGYARCALELMEQSRELGFELTDVMHASSSAGTQAGLLAGFAGLVLDGDGAAPRIHGINVSEQDPAVLPEEIMRLVREVLTERALETAVAPEDVLVDDRYLGDGYGLPSDATVEAIRLLAATEGVLLDPVYSGKAFAALVGRVRAGEFAGVDDLVFIHTGGTASLAVYDTAFD
jgi:L-cysteate sulfo-lyase